MSASEIEAADYAFHAEESLLLAEESFIAGAETWPEWSDA